MDRAADIATLNLLIEHSSNEYPDNPAVSSAFQKPLTYSQLFEIICALSLVLHEEDISKGDRVAILAENSPEWGMAYFAIVRLGAIAVPILPDFLETDVHHILKESKAKILFTTQRQLEKLYEFQCDSLKKIVTLDDFRPHKQLLATETLKDFLAKSSEVSPGLGSKVTETAASIKSTDMASIIYTSGTSGHSKAVMLSHGNFVANVESTKGIVQIKPDWTFLSILPMSHAYEFTIGLLLPLASGSRIVYAGKSPTPTILEKICRVEKPTVMCIVPMVMEKIYKKRILAKIEASRLLKAISRVPFLRKKIYRQISSRLLDFFGGKLKLLAIGGAALNFEVEKFMIEAQFPYIVGYGLTECAPLLAGGPFPDPTIIIGSTGKPVPGVEIKIVNADSETGIGEIHARGPNIMLGYLDNPEQTRETIDQDGWLATGDLGYIDQWDNLHIKGRSKSVIVLSSGENIYPEAVEEKINAEIHVLESLVTENNNQLEAWVYLDYDLIDNETRGKTQQQKMEHIAFILKSIKDSTNSRLPLYSKIARVVEREEPFTKTATHKIKRYLYARP